MPKVSAYGKLYVGNYAISYVGCDIKIEPHKRFEKGNYAEKDGYYLFEQDDEALNTVIPKRKFQEVCQILSEEISDKYIKGIYPRDYETIIKEMQESPFLNGLAWDRAIKNVIRYNNDMRSEIQSIPTSDVEGYQDLIILILKPAFRRVYPEGVTEYDYSLEQALGL